MIHQALSGFHGLVYLPSFLSHADKLTGLTGRPTFRARNTAQAEDFFVDSLSQWREAQGLDRMILVGHSLGGYLSACYALRHPEHISHLILVCPAGVVILIPIPSSYTSHLPPHPGLCSWHLHSLFPAHQMCVSNRPEQPANLHVRGSAKDQTQPESNSVASQWAQITCMSLMLLDCVGNGLCGGAMAVTHLSWLVSDPKAHK